MRTICARARPYSSPSGRHKLTHYLRGMAVNRRGAGMRQLEVENQLRDVVSRIIVQVELATSQGRTDINLALEDAFIPILKSVYNLPHLVNLNRKQKNFPGIDLGDDHDRVNVSDLAESPELDNVNILKQLLSVETREQLKQRRVRTHNKDGFFFFGPTEEGQLERRETWIGKRTAIRRVFEVKYQRKDPSKVAHQKHFSFELTFTKLGDDWYAQIVPSWYYSYDGYRQSRWHDELLSAQKRLEHNAAVRNMVRFVAYFLSGASSNEDEDHGLRFLSLVEFNVQNADEAKPVGDDDEEDIQVVGGTAS